MKTTVLDPDVWEDLSALPPGALIHIIDTYLDSSLVVLRLVQRAAVTGETNTLRHLLHQLQGSSASLGVLPVAAQCTTLEQQVQTGALINMPAALRVLEVTYAQGAHALGKRRQAALLKLTD